MSTIVMRNHFSELSSLFCIYFGQDYDLFTDTETAEGVIDGFLEQNGSQIIRDILEEAKAFQATYAGRIDEGMAEHFPNEFVPESWDITAVELFAMLQRKAAQKLEQLKRT
ncbi:MULTISPECIES: contact-dependent growth inhibition system immunity protein [Serratia]|uniref:contact-dependent growth inhibition system immunity protein n=1 Tax=Serratia TaxID=613 RepID=UPI0021BDCBCE|nr:MULTISPECIES: contact-dependent growth inhibition system immunity protein [Serratia]